MKEHLVGLRELAFRLWRPLLLFPVLALIAAVVRGGVVFGFGLFSAPVFWAFAACIVAGFGIGAVGCRLSSRWRGLLYGLVMALAFGMMLDLGSLLVDVLSSTVAKAAWFLINSAIVGIFILLNDRLIRVVAVFLALILAPNLIELTLNVPLEHLPSGARSPDGPLGRVLVDVIFDEHIGLDGIPGDAPSGLEMREMMTRTFVGSGFHLYAGAYSPYMMTTESVPASFGLDAPSPEKITPESLMARWKQQLPWLKHLTSEGYKTTVLTVGSSFNLCYMVNRREVAHCLLEPVASPYYDERLSLIIITLGRSWTVRQSCLRVNQKHGCKLHQLGPSNARETVDIVRSVIASSSGDIAIVAHVLLPHGPFILDRKCEFTAGQPSTYPSRNDQLKVYFDQMECSWLQLGKILDAIAARGALERATVIAHGDHGLRPLFPMEQAERVAWRLPMHSALFALRAPGVAPGVDHEHYTVQELLAAFAAKRPPRLGDGKILTPTADYAPGSLLSSNLSASLARSKEIETLPVGDWR